MTDQNKPAREWTGKHMLFTMVGAFGVIIAVNIYMATQAVGTFPGLETKNSYVVSQQFDGDRAAQVALGWDVTAEVRGDELILSITDADGNAVNPPRLTGVFGRATSVRDDQTPEFRFDGQVHRAPVMSEGGNWNLRMEATAIDGTPFRQRVVVLVAE